MAEHAVRAFAVAGVFATIVVCGGVTAAPVFADPDGGGEGSSQSSGGSAGDSGSPSSSGSGSTSNSASSEGGDAGGSRSEEKAAPDPAPDPEVTKAVPDASPVESSGGGSDGGSKSSASVDIAPPGKGITRSEFGSSITVPLFRLPAPGEIPAGSWPTASTFYTTVQIPVPTFRDFLTALRIIPPAPPPGPAFRTQEEAPVADSTTGTAVGAMPGGGSGGSDSPVFRAPLVVSVPRAVTIAGGAPRTTPAQVGTTEPGVAGVRTPVIRGAVEPTPGVTAEPTAPVPMAAGPGTVAGGAAAPRPSGLPRVVLNPTLAEIAAVALPGVAGLAFLTFGGGVIGYRQANSLRFVRTAGAERFLP